jgi:hypothetical protein
MRKCENGEYERATTCLFQYGDDDAGGVVKTERWLVWYGRVLRHGFTAFPLPIRQEVFDNPRHDGKFLSFTNTPSSRSLLLSFFTTSAIKKTHSESICIDIVSSSPRVNGLFQIKSATRDLIPPERRDLLRILFAKCERHTW